MAKKVVATLKNPKSKNSALANSQLKDVSSLGVSGSNLTVNSLDFLKVD